MVGNDTINYWLYYFTFITVIICIASEDKWKVMFYIAYIISWIFVRLFSHYKCTFYALLFFSLLLGLPTFFCGKRGYQQIFMAVGLTYILSLS